MKLPECQGDPRLAAFFAELSVRPQLSRVTTVDMLATAVNSGVVARGQHFVDLSCGHKAITKIGTGRVRCLRCAEMYRHGLDMDGYLKGKVRDTLIWREDPCRAANEPTDLGGNFIEDVYD